MREESLRLGAPGGQGALGLGGFAEDEAENHVEAAEGEEKEGGHEREVVDVVREHARGDQALEDAQGAEAERRPKDGEKAVEEGGGPAELGEQEDDDLEEDEQTVDDGPEDAGGLVGHGAPENVVAVEQGGGGKVSRLLVGLEGVDGLDVCDHDEDAAREHEQECDDAQDADAVEANKDICARGKHCMK